MKAKPVKRAFKYRFHPTDEQAAELTRTFGCVRRVYNLALDARTTAWSQRQERVNYNATSAMLTDWKKTAELSFLAEVSSVPLQQALRHLQAAFANFWAGWAKYPQFKSKRKTRRAAEYTRSGFRFRDGCLTLAKMAGPLDIVWSRPLPEGAEPSTVTVSQDSAGRWFVSMLCEDVSVKPLPVVDAVVGIDVGITALLTLSTGEKIANPRYERRERERLAKAQRNLAKKENGSRNRDKARVKVARVHARIADRRRDGLHKLTTRLVHENQVVVIEDLSVQNMLRNRTLARAISDAAWSEFRSMLEYKAGWYGRTVITVERWYPSTKTCSGCRYVKASVPLGERTFRCGRCPLVLDRDVNAARNIKAAGLAVLACGAAVRPQRRIPRGQSAMKQEPRRATVAGLSAA
ncbi:RNA-guided endonuclease InsQ/TnpB family protein [Kitasatospora sp. GAS1066B]|uniref:RNA-guided endonuclease InsQ/TnpB family protein n=1 Tax=Kitasatospora sp. GAS1066B TaxID=3156271 RepID=UPI00351423E9